MQPVTAVRQISCAVCLPGSSPGNAAARHDDGAPKLLIHGVELSWLNGLDFEVPLSVDVDPGSAKLLSDLS